MLLRRLVPLLLILFVLIGSGASGALAQGSAPNNPAAPDALAGPGFTYQGELTNGSGPVSGSCDFQFSLFNASSGGVQVGATQTVLAVSVANGRFTVLLNNTAQFGARAFDGSARWLAIAVRCPAGSGSFTPLAQRQPLTPAPLALALPGLRTEQEPDGPNVIGGFLGNIVSAGAEVDVIGGGGAAGAVNRALASGGTIGGGVSNTVGTQVLASALAGPAGLSVLQLPPVHPRATRGGPAGPSAPSASLGGIEATVGGGQQNTASEDGSTVGGGLNNTASGFESTIAGGVNNIVSLGDATVGGGNGNLASGAGATVAGGDTNGAADIYATVGGGLGNNASMFGAIGGGVQNLAGDTSTVAGGDQNNAGGPGAAIGGGGWDGVTELGNTALGDASTIGGGLGNVVTISGTYGTVGGGYSNTVSGETSVIAGGWINTASADNATVGGGITNTASGIASTVPGGQNNTASGAVSFAAGYGAHAIHNGAFVWADGSSNSPFASSAANQFLIRAAGGVGVGTNQPVDVMDVSGTVNGTATPSTTVMLIEDPATGGGGPDLLALRDRNILTPATNANFITFFGSSDSSLGAIQGDGLGGVTLAGPGNDFAEYLPKQSAAETLTPGDIVGVHAGQLSRQTAGADQVLVISTEPIVAGNAPGGAAPNGLALAALIGQASVRVGGGVAAGDFILPSGQGDGVGLAVAPANLSPAQAAQIVGLALEGAAGAGVHSVRIAVGLPRDQVWAGLMARQDADLQARVTALEKQAAPVAQSSPAAAPSPAPQGLPGSALPWLLLAGLGLLNLGGVAGYLLARQRVHHV